VHRGVHAAIRPGFHPGTSGGVEQYVKGLARALGALDGADRFAFVGDRIQRDALAPFVHGAATWVALPESRALRLKIWFAATRPGRVAVKMKARLPRSTAASVAAIPRAPQLVDETYDVVHYPTQGFELTPLPSLYQPWDLQHLHHPEFFSDAELSRRAAYEVGCRRAAYVVVASSFVRDDVVSRYSIDPARVAVVPPGAPLTSASLPVRSGRPYALYPAQTWSHKNHERLIDAIAIMRGRGTEVRLICPGQPNARDTEVRAHAASRGVRDLVEFPGHVTDAELAGLYAGARCLVFPSLFEGFGFPVLEAFVAGAPVACASTTSLPELAGDAAVLFDPIDVESMADAITRVWEDDGLRAALIERGHVRASLYSWDHLARSCRALYLAAAGLDLEPDDETLLVCAGVSA